VAAYKAAELTRELQRRGAEVQVVLTASGERFVTPLTFAALSGRQVLTSLWSASTGESAAQDAASFDIEHIRIAQEIDAVVIAPATANTIARLAHGMADDLLSTIVLATKAPVLLAPAMNVNMWHSASVQQNIATLRARGVRIMDPGAGELACGMVGEGRLAEPTEIADAVIAVLVRVRDLDGETILITTGGTREPIDAVRYIANRSSGKMGFALAEAALDRGARVILVTAAGAAPLACEQILVNTAAEMQQAVLAQLSGATTVIMAAAVSDYSVAEPSQHKRKKTESLSLELTQNDDILKQVAQQRRPGTIVIGFAAETDDLLNEGRRKLREKGVDAILANDVSMAGSGFDASHNAGVLITHDEEFAIPLTSKREMSDQILDRLGSLKTEVSTLQGVKQRVSSTLLSSPAA
jgi:phosphopantothenoylcysteine decarboxylase/phosphopantothenate--cysteine ligase